MRIRVLIDNIAPEGLLCEWGLSFLIEYGGKSFLLDMGQSDNFAKNAEMLQEDLAAAEAGVLSHAHYDHADGMGAFFEINPHAKLFIRKGAGENCYGLNEEGNLHYIGIRQGFLEKYADRIVYVEGDREISEGVFLIPHKMPGREEIGDRVGMKIRVGDGWKTDTFDHEQSLVFRAERGLVILNSCSHAGPRHVIADVRDAFPEEHILAYLGGLHQYRSTPEEVRELANLLNELEIEHIYTGHCTGEEAFGILKEMLGEKIGQFSSGFEIRFK